MLMYKVRYGVAPDYISELFNFANKGYSLSNGAFDISRYSTERYGTWDNTFGPGYPEVIDSDLRWTIEYQKERPNLLYWGHVHKL